MACLYLGEMMGIAHDTQKEYKDMMPCLYLGEQTDR
jgi:hypothetical protein